MASDKPKGRPWSPKTRQFAYEICVIRDGEFCQLCARFPAQLEDPLEVDHKNGNRNDDRGANFRLLCKTCNGRKGGFERVIPVADRGRFQPEVDRMVSDSNGGVRINQGGVRLNGNGHHPPPPVSPQNGDSRGGNNLYTDSEPQPLGTLRSKEGIDASTAPPGILLNMRYERAFKVWLLDEIKRGERWTKEGAANAGAALVDCSPNIALGYLKKITSDYGELQEAPDGQGVIWLEPRYPMFDYHHVLLASLRAEWSGDDLAGLQSMCPPHVRVIRMKTRQRPPTATTRPME